MGGEALCAPLSSASAAGYKRQSCPPSHLVEIGLEEQRASLAAEVRASETAGYAGSRIDLASLDATARRLT